MRKGKPMSQKGVLVVISGFSGAGKGTLMKELLKQYPNYALSVSATTRQPRPGEIDGREYYFVTENEFDEMIAKDQMIEYACYCGRYYGTPRTYVEEQMASGKDVLLEIEIQGALQIKKKFPETILIFITTPSAEILKNRLVGRGTETPEVIAARLARAVEESRGIEEYDYVLVNDDLAECTALLHRVIQDQHHRACNQMDFIEKTREELKGFCQ